MLIPDILCPFVSATVLNKYNNLITMKAVWISLSKVRSELMYFCFLSGRPRYCQNLYYSITKSGAIPVLSGPCMFSSKFGSYKNVQSAIGLYDVQHPGRRTHEKEVDLVVLESIFSAAV